MTLTKSCFVLFFKVHYRSKFTLVKIRSPIFYGDCYKVGCTLDPTGGPLSLRPLEESLTFPNTGSAPAAAAAVAAVIHRTTAFFIVRCHTSRHDASGNTWQKLTCGCCDDRSHATSGRRYVEGSRTRCALAGVQRASVCLIATDQPNSRLHGRDIFREIGLLPWKTLISVKSVVFLWILTLLFSFMKVSEFYHQHLCGFCCLLCVTLEHLTVLSLDLVFIYVVNIRCSEISNALFDRFLSLH